MKMLLIGAIIWQTLTVLIATITNENEDIYIPVAFGIWEIIFMIIRKIIRVKRHIEMKRENKD